MFISGSKLENYKIPKLTAKEKAAKAKDKAQAEKKDKDKNEGKKKERKVNEIICLIIEYENYNRIRTRNYC